MAKRIGDLVGGMVPTLGDGRAMGQNIMGEQPERDFNDLGGLLAQRPQMPTWAKIAMVVADGLRGYQGEDPMFAPMLERRNRDDEDWNRTVQLEGFKSRQRLEEQRRKAMEPQYDYFDDNAGNRWRINKTNNQVDADPVFVDQAPKQYFQDGRLINVPNPYARGGQSAQSDTYTDPEDGRTYKLKPGGNRKNPNDWQAMGGPTPQASGGFRR